MINLSTYQELNDAAQEDLLELVFSRLLTIADQLNETPSDYYQHDIREQLEEADRVLDRFSSDPERITLARNLLIEIHAIDKGDGYLEPEVMYI